jgi:hypothetical protein
VASEIILCIAPDFMGSCSTFVFPSHTFAAQDF